MLIIIMKNRNSEILSYSRHHHVTTAFLLLSTMLTKSISSFMYTILLSIVIQCWWLFVFMSIIGITFCPVHRSSDDGCSILYQLGYKTSSGIGLVVYAAASPVIDVDNSIIPKNDDVTNHTDINTTTNNESIPQQLSTTILANSSSSNTLQYGLDCSFPIHSHLIQCNSTYIFGGIDKQKYYNQYMNNCRNYYNNSTLFESFNGYKCDNTEKHRIQQNIRQPQSILNYTNTGYYKMNVPNELFRLIYQFWKTNQNNGMIQEIKYIGNTYTNHWESLLYLMNINNITLIGGGKLLEYRIIESIQSIMEEWTGTTESFTSIHGIRKYTNGAILSPHIDRIPLIHSCIIHIDNESEEEWPLEVIDRNGNAINITMNIGEMILYESASLIHSRPYPFNGKYYANLFVHFEPLYSPPPNIMKINNNNINVQKNDWDDNNGFYPPYMIPDSPESYFWKERNPLGWSRQAIQQRNIVRQQEHQQLLLLQAQQHQQQQQHQKRNDDDMGLQRNGEL